VLRCHAKIDTGMGRLGFPWFEASTQIPPLVGLPGIDLCGACTHFASSDVEDPSFMEKQARRFRHVIEACETAGVALPFKHVSNSGALLRNPALDMQGVRPGIVLYGYEQGNTPRGIVTRPFLQWKTRVLQVKGVPAGFTVSYGSTYVADQPTRIATIDVGYADGFSRLLSNRGSVLIRGRRFPVAGRVTMSLVSVDVGNDMAITPGDEVVLLGTQGDEGIWADEIAQQCGTISYEILTSIRPEAQRVAGSYESTTEHFNTNIT
jgi:alanine racemase